MSEGVLLCVLEAVEGGFSLLEVMEVMRCVLLCMLESVEVSSVCWGCRRRCAMCYVLFCLRGGCGG